MSWTVYLLAAAKRTYVGVTTDLRRRLQQHNGELRGGARSTRVGRPWRVARRWGPFASRGEALRIEHRVKRLRGAARRSFALALAFVLPLAPPRPIQEENQEKNQEKVRENAKSDAVAWQAEFGAAVFAK